jgi:hypothetical protein
MCPGEQAAKNANTDAHPVLRRQSGLRSLYPFRNVRGTIFLDIIQERPRIYLDDDHGTINRL